ALKISPYSPNPDRFAPKNSLCVEHKGARRLLTIQTARKTGRAIIIECDLSTTEEAENLIGADLWVHPSMRPPLPPGEFYLDELLGLRVETQTGEDLGAIEEVLETPAHNVYVTPYAMIPGIPEFVLSTDWENRVLVVRDVPGLKIKEEA
ncbi:MAG: rRNA processing protein RimM, partial [Abditibacteriota bacterium]|nr:rRNA processing protein RimM [Abditibacteriota bacterium]